MRAALIHFDSTIHKPSLPKYITLLRIPVRQDQLLNTAVLISKIQVLPVFWVSNILRKLIPYMMTLNRLWRQPSACGSRRLELVCWIPSSDNSHISFGKPDNSDLV
jgi:hypothetical protein